MPRISRKNREKLLQALCKSDSDDDNDLLQPNVHLQPSQRSPDSSVDTPTKVSIELPVQVPVESKEKFEERGKKRNGWKQASRMHHSHCQTQILVPYSTGINSHSLTPSFSHLLASLFLFTSSNTRRTSIDFVAAKRHDSVLIQSDRQGF
jgi:hypothetical protein